MIIASNPYSASRTSTELLFFLTTATGRSKSFKYESSEQPINIKFHIIFNANKIPKLDNFVSSSSIVFPWFHNNDWPNTPNGQIWVATSNIYIEISWSSKSISRMLVRNPSLRMLSFVQPGLHKTPHSVQEKIGTLTAPRPLALTLAKVLVHFAM